MHSLRITLIQTDLTWENKSANLQMLGEKIRSVSAQTEVVILPEMFSTGFSMQPEKLAENMEGETLLWMRKIAAEKKIILTGSVIIEEENKFYNRLIWMQPDGKYGIYDKRHLFSYAGEHEHYSPGNNRLIAQVKGWKINVQVCYDLRFPVWSRQQSSQKAEPEFDLLIYVANWPERRSHAWKTLLSARAIENQCYVIGVNRVGNDGNGIYHSGNSMVIDPLGAELYHKAEEEDVFSIELDKKHLQEIRQKFPFLEDADDFSIHL